MDIARQVLFLVDDEGKVGNILPISSGSGKSFHENGYPETHAVTPCGHLEVFSKASGWKKSPLGEMHNPLYIVGGIAIHGSQDVPAYPASHGCIRIPMFASHACRRWCRRGRRSRSTAARRTSPRGRSLPHPSPAPRRSRRSRA